MFKKLLKTLRQKWQQFDQWQRRGPSYVVSVPVTHHCYCCDTDYEGNYCPVCGQKTGGKRITWSTVRRETMDLWGLGTRSLPYTLWQLIWRPGYMIADYISGKRQVSFPPVKMLFIMAIFVLLIETLVNSGNADAAEQTKEAVTHTEKLIEWLGGHSAWAALVLSSFFILPTYIVFRHSPRCTQHTLPEGFFIQVFIAVETIMFSILPDSSTIGKTASIVMTLVVVGGVIWLRTYYQLFGYGVWSTLWRVLLVILTGLGFLILFVLIGTAIDSWMGGDIQKAKACMWGIGLVVVPSAIALWGANKINKRTARQRQ